MSAHDLRASMHSDRVGITWLMVRCRALLRYVVLSPKQARGAGSRAVNHKELCHAP